MGTNSAIRCSRVLDSLTGHNARKVGASLSAIPPLVQPKLSFGAVDDAYEREADRIAEAVMRMPEPRAVLHQDNSETLQRQTTNTATMGEVPSIVHEVLASPGQPLDRETRAYMETHLGHDFSKVRVHTDD